MAHSGTLFHYPLRRAARVPAALFGVASVLFLFAGPGACARGTGEELEDRRGPEAPQLEAGPGARPGDAAAGSTDAGTDSGAASDATTGGRVMGGDAGCSSAILINEVQVEGPVSSADEFVELHNPNSCAVAVGSWQVEYRSQSGSLPVVVHQFAASAKLAAGAHFVLGGVAFNRVKDVGVSATLDANGGQIALLDPAKKVVDSLGYGASASGIYVETAPATKPPAGQSIGRKSGFPDTNNNATDFHVGAPTPRAANP